MSLRDATKPVCTVRISGGLGNQLFQYAAGRALALRTGSELQLDLSFYDKGRHRMFQLDKLPIHAEVTRPAGAFRAARRCRSLLRRVLGADRFYREAHYHYDAKFELLQPPITLDGYFQSELYFARYAEFIRSELAIPEPQDTISLRLSRQMSEVVATALHIRRGDYVTNSKISRLYAPGTIDYYTRALEHIPGADPVFVFSDDIGWAKQNLPAVKPLVFSEANVERSALADLWLMTRAHHHIIANSSFSWWGAWLADASRGLTIAPRQWFNDVTVNDSDLIPPHWIRL